MFQSIWEDIKSQFRYGNMITRLIIANAAVFVTLHLINAFYVLFQGWKGNRLPDIIAPYASASSDLVWNLTHPWVVVSHMFFHVGLWHFAFNMLILYWFGRIVGDLIGNHRVLAIYLLGGLFGFFAYVLFGQLFYEQGVAVPAYGASAAVLAFVIASAVLAPEYEMRLILLGPVKLKYIALAFIVVDLIGFGGLNNTGGHAAHLGGALFGWLFIQQLRNNNDLSKPVNNIMDGIVSLFSTLSKPQTKKKSKLTVVHKRKPDSDGPVVDDSFQEKLDTILDKIKADGYESLTEEEKEFLFDASKKT